MCAYSGQGLLTHCVGILNTFSESNLLTLNEELNKYRADKLISENICLKDIFVNKDADSFINIHRVLIDYAGILVFLKL